MKSFPFHLLAAPEPPAFRAGSDGGYPEDGGGGLVRPVMQDEAEQRRLPLPDSWHRLGLEEVDGLQLHAGEGMAQGRTGVGQSG